MPKKINAEDKKTFLKIYENSEHHYSIRKSCKEANIGKSTFYRWLKDLVFKKKIDKIKKKRSSDPFKQIKKGNVRASIKFLKMYGKSRGY